MADSCIHIPLFNGISGDVYEHMGIGFILVAITVDVLTIAMTGISSIGCAVRMKLQESRELT